MKKIIALTLGILIAMAAIAIAAPKLTYDGSRPPVPIQNVTGMAPAKGKSGCVTQAITKGTFGTYTSMSGYLQYEGEVVTAAGAAEPVKWKLDGTQVSAGPSFKMTNEGASTYSRAVQEVYSGASRSLTSCVRRR